MNKSLSAILPVTISLSHIRAQSTSLSLSDNASLADFLKPDANDYIHVPIRALSATPVQNGIIDFSHAGGAALKNATQLFNGLTIFKDHDTTVSNWLGKTSAAFWDDQTPGVPPGVNLTLDVDVKADPKVARGLLSGALDSGSVTISFNFDQSHPDMDPFDFLMNLGSKVDGETVRALVTDVTRCLEYSVVWQGADAYAKVIGEDGKIIVPGMSKQSLSLNKPNKEKPKMNKEQLALLGLDEGATEAQIAAALLAQSNTLTAIRTEHTAVSIQLAQVQSELGTAQMQVTTLNAEVANLKPQAELGSKFLQGTRDEALRLYNLVEGAKATEALRTLIGSASLEVAQSFVSSYKERAEAIAPLACKNCGCKDVTRGAAVPTDVPPVNVGQENAAAEQLKKALSYLHGK